MTEIIITPTHQLSVIRQTMIFLGVPSRTHGANNMALNLLSSIQQTIANLPYVRATFLISPHPHQMRMGYGTVT